MYVCGVHVCNCMWISCRYVRWHCLRLPCNLQCCVHATCLCVCVQCCVHGTSLCACNLSSVALQPAMLCACNLQCCVHATCNAVCMLSVRLWQNPLTCHNVSLLPQCKLASLASLRCRSHAIYQTLLHFSASVHFLSLCIFVTAFLSQIGRAHV